MSFTFVGPQFRLNPLVLALACGVSTHAAAQTEVESTTLSNVVVSAAGFEQEVEDAPASITVVPREELEQKAYKDVFDALRDVPGVAITGSGSKSDISMRGMSSSYTVMLVDGKRQNSRETRPNSDGPGIEQGWLPPLGAIERIEVIRGPMSSLYGSDALGGVVNVITRKVAKEWTGSVRTETTLQQHGRSGNTAQGQFWVAGPLVQDKLGIQVYSQKMHRAEDYFVGGMNGHDTTSHTAKLSLMPTPDHDLTLEVNRTKQIRSQTVGRIEDVEDGEDDSDNLTNHTVALTHNGQWGKATTTSFVQHEKSINPGRDMIIKNTEFNSVLSLPLGDSHFGTLGFSYKREALHDGENQLMADMMNQIKRDQWALYAENEWSVTDAFALTAGLRLNHDSNYGKHWTPRLYGVWRATDNWTIKGGVSTGFHAPDLREATQDWGQATGGRKGKAVILGNPNLKPEKSLSEEIAVVWDNRDNFNTSLTVYHTDFKDRITSNTYCNKKNGEVCTLRGKTYDFLQDRLNVDRATIDGLEATATWQATKALRLSTNYTHTRSKQKSGENKGKPLNRLPKHLFNVAADWQANDKLGVWSRVHVHGRTTEGMSYGTPVVTPSYTFADAGLNYQVSKDVRVGFAVYNLLDRQVNKEHGYDVTYDGRRYWLNMTAGF